MISAVALVVLATLLPVDAEPLPLRACLVCGERGAADALLNILLFVPFGASLAARSAPASRTVLWGLALSLAVEALQIAIAGRDPSLGDVVFNALGAWTGRGLYFTVRKASMVSTTTASRLAVLTASFALFILTMGAVLLTPGFPKQAYYGQWTPDFANAEQYEGRVLAARVGAIEVRDGMVLESGQLRTRLLRGDELELHVVAGKPPVRAAPVFNIYDAQQREIISVAAEGMDVLVRYRVRAAAIGLDRPTLRFPGFLRTVGRGERWSARLRLVAGGVCIEIERLRECPVGYSAARSWALLMHTDVPREVERVLDHLWLAVLLVPAGSLVRRPATMLLLLPFSLIGLLAVSRFTVLLPVPGTAFAAACGGLLFGAWLGRRCSTERIQRGHE